MEERDEQTKKDRFKWEKNEPTEKNTKNFSINNVLPVVEQRSKKKKKKAHRNKKTMNKTT